MLGRTHMAIGALGAVVAVPMLLHDASAHAMVMSVEIGHAVRVRELIEGVVMGALGGILPDLDQKDGLMTRKVETVGQVAMFIALLALLIATHLWTSPLALGVALFMFLSFVHHAEWVRKTSLILLAIGALYFGLSHPADQRIGVCAAIWFGVTAFSKHRTFTHSILGFVVAAFVLIQMGEVDHLKWLADTALVGYGLHIVADSIAGGVPLFWPFGKRQGIRLVLTGKRMDHLIGSLSAALVLVCVIMWV